jgi:hypothetical protein
MIQARIARRQAGEAEERDLAALNSEVVGREIEVDGEAQPMPA